jgi:hypothetical protein
MMLEDTERFISKNLCYKNGTTVQNERYRGAVLKPEGMGAGILS